jgi:hypothetical protein
VSLFYTHFQKLFTNIIFVFINKKLLSFKNPFLCSFSGVRFKRRVFTSNIFAGNIILSRGHHVARELRVARFCSKITTARSTDSLGC